jgi:transcriptional regulator with XRE-family HTH domain
MDAEEARTIGRRVKRIRYARRKSLVVAGLAGMSKSKLDRIERGESALDKLSDIVALADALAVAPGDLVRLPVPANGHIDSTTEAVGHALDAIEDEDPEGLVLPVAMLRELSAPDSRPAASLPVR